MFDCFKKFLHRWGFWDFYEIDASAPPSPRCDEDHSDGVHWFTPDGKPPAAPMTIRLIAYPTVVPYNDICTIRFLTNYENAYDLICRETFDGVYCEEPRAEMKVWPVYPRVLHIDMHDADGNVLATAEVEAIDTTPASVLEGLNVFGRYGAFREVLWQGQYA